MCEICKQPVRDGATRFTHRITRAVLCGRCVDKMPPLHSPQDFDRSTKPLAEPLPRAKK